MIETVMNIGVAEWASILAIGIGLAQVYRVSSNFFSKLRMNRINSHKLALESGLFTSFEKRAVEESYAQESFRLVFGLLAHRKMRTALCQFIEQSNGAVNTFHIKKVYPEITLVDDRLRIRCSVGLLLSTAYAVFAAVSLGVLGSLLVSHAYLDHIEEGKQLSAFTVGVLFIFVSASFGVDVNKYSIVKKLQKELARQQSQ
ncbi:hypothetical protein [Vibrio sp. TRT 1302]|uniref:hypothetical protein n=1 Tax=Vibrio sp. TRT 1302 TaxID=3418504 RepID=UPI003CF61ECF